MFISKAVVGYCKEMKMKMYIRELEIMILFLKIENRFSWIGVILQNKQISKMQTISVNNWNRRGKPWLMIIWKRKKTTNWYYYIIVPFIEYIYTLILWQKILIIILFCYFQIVCLLLESNVEDMQESTFNATSIVV